MTTKCPEGRIVEEAIWALLISVLMLTKRVLSIGRVLEGLQMEVVPNLLNCRVKILPIPGWVESHQDQQHLVIQVWSLHTVVDNRSVIMRIGIKTSELSRISFSLMIIRSIIWSRMYSPNKIVLRNFTKGLIRMFINHWRSSYLLTILTL